MIEISQEQMDKFIAEELQPLTDNLIEYAKSQGVDPNVFYLCNLSIAQHVLKRYVEQTPEYTKVARFLEQTGSEVATELLRHRLIKAEEVSKENT